MEAALTRAHNEASVALAAATEKNATKDGTMDKQDAMDYEMMQAEHTATLKRLQGEYETALAEAAEEKERAAALEAALQDSREATNQAIALAEEASQETEQVREELAAVMRKRGTDDVDQGGFGESVNASNDTTETAQLIEKIKLLEEAEADLQESQRVILDACTALAQVTAGGEDLVVDGESGPDRLHELVKIVAGRVSTLSSMLPSFSPLILVRRLLWLKSFASCLRDVLGTSRNRRGEGNLLVGKLSSDSRLC